MRLALALAAAAVVLAACGPAAQDQQAAAPAAETSCPDDGPRLAGTGLCKGRAVNYLDPALASAPGDLPEGCVWTMNDAVYADDLALLYQAADCKGVVTQLEIRGGARSASVGYVKSGVFGDIPADYEPLKLFPLDGVADPQAMILDMARQTTTDKAEAEACVVRPLDGQFGPAGAFVIDVSDAYKKSKPKDYVPGEVEPSACGQWGYVGDGVAYWRIANGYAWFFDFGQDLPDFNPASMILMRKGADGTWTTP